MNKNQKSDNNIKFEFQLIPPKIKGQCNSIKEFVIIIGVFAFIITLISILSKVL